MKARLVFVLVGLVGAICGGLYLVGNKLASESAAERPFLATITEPQMLRIDLKGVDSKDQVFDWALVREASKADGKPGGWVLADGKVGIERTEAVKFFQSLKMLLRAHEIDDSDVLSKPEIFGLDRPELTVEIKTTQPATPLFSLVFGKKHQFSGRRYLRVNSEPRVYLVEEQAYLAIKKQRADLELKSPLRFDTSLVDRVEIDRAAPVGSGRTGINLVRDGGGVWTVAPAEPNSEASVADSTLVKDLLSALSSSQVEESVVLASAADPAAAEYGTLESNTSPKVRVRLHFQTQAEPNPLLLKFGEKAATPAGQAQSDQVQLGQGGTRPGKQYFVQAGGSPVVFRLKQRPKQDLFQPASYFWTRTPLSKLVSEGVTRIRIVTDGRSAMLNSAQAGDSTDQNDLSQQHKQFDFLLTRLAELRVLSYENPADQGAPAEVKSLLIELTGGDGATYSIEVLAPVEVATDPVDASRFPPYVANITIAHHRPLRCIVSGAEVELFKELHKRIA